MGNFEETNLMQGKVLFEENDYKYVWLGWDKNSEKEIIQTNQYLIMTKNEGVLLDPGGVSTFSKVVATISQYISLEKIIKIFFSHQDPDVSSGIAMWLGVTRANIHISNKWIRFLPHFGIFDSLRIQPIQDKGGQIPIIGYQPLQIVPSHFLHSPGQHSVYDPNSKILFTGDIGAAVFPKDQQYLFVTDFEKHKKIMEPFHQRYMASNKALRYWVDKIRKLDVGMICPQHGAIFDKNTVPLFLNWLYDLKCGVDLIDSISG